MSIETESMHALALEARETVILSRQFYSYVVKDPRHASGEHVAVTPSMIPKMGEVSIIVEAAPPLQEEKSGLNGTGNKLPIPREEEEDNDDD
jgi:hypothetical protein